MPNVLRKQIIAVCLYTLLLFSMSTANFFLHLNGERIIALDRTLSIVAVIGIIYLLFSSYLDCVYLDKSIGILKVFAAFAALAFLVIMYIVPLFHPDYGRYNIYNAEVGIIPINILFIIEVVELLSNKSYSIEASDRLLYSLIGISVAINFIGFVLGLVYKASGNAYSIPSMIFTILGCAAALVMSFTSSSIYFKYLAKGVIVFLALNLIGSIFVGIRGVNDSILIQYISYYSAPAYTSGMMAIASILGALSLVKEPEKDEKK